MEELINQNSEGYLIIFIVGGALAIMVYMFIQSPKKFLKWLFKDIVEQFLNSSKQNEKEKEENERE